MKLFPSVRPVRRTFKIENGQLAPKQRSIPTSYQLKVLAVAQKAPQSKSKIFTRSPGTPKHYLPRIRRLSTIAQRRTRVKVIGQVIPSPVGPAIE